MLSVNLSTTLALAVTFTLAQAASLPGIAERQLLPTCPLGKASYCCSTNLDDRAFGNRKGAFNGCMF